MAQLRNLDVEWVSLVDRAAVRNAENPDQPQRFLLTKGEVPVWKRDNPTPPTGGDMPTDTMTAEETQAALQKAETERDAALTKHEQAETHNAELVAKIEDLEKAAKKTPPADNEPDEDDMMKADLPPAVRALIAKAEADAADTRLRLEKAEEMAKSERDARLTREFIAKAQGMPGSADELGPVLKTVADAISPEAFGTLETVLKAAGEQIRAGELLKEAGAGGEARKSGAYDEALAKAQELRKSDSGLSQSAAIDRVFSENRELEARYLAENR